MPMWENEIPITEIRFGLGSELSFSGKLEGPAGSVDQRLYYATCIRELSEQGVSFRFDKIDKTNVDAVVDEFDVVIDCTGKKGSPFPFPVESIQKPQRKFAYGYFLGMEMIRPYSFSGTIFPGLGEIMEIPSITDRGEANIISIAAIPDQDLDFSRKKISGAEHFTLTVKETLKQIAPHIYSRVDEDSFALSDDKAFLLTAVPPTVKRPYTLVQDKLVFGCGDSVFLHDPLTGQGSNLAAHSAKRLSELLIENKNSSWDEEMGEAYWASTKPMVTAVSMWGDAFTSEMPPHMMQLFMQATQDQEIADSIARWYENPFKAMEAFYPEESNR